MPSRLFSTELTDGDCRVLCYEEPRRQRGLHRGCPRRIDRQKRQGRQARRLLRHDVSRLLMRATSHTTDLDEAERPRLSRTRLDPSRRPDRDQYHDRCIPRSPLAPPHSLYRAAFLWIRKHCFAKTASGEFCFLPPSLCPDSVGGRLSWYGRRLPHRTIGPFERRRRDPSNLPTMYLE